MLAIGQHSEVNGSLLGPRCVLHAQCVVGSPILIVGEQAGTVMAVWTQHTCVLLWLTCYAGPVQRSTSMLCVLLQSGLSAAVYKHSSDVPVGQPVWPWCLLPLPRMQCAWACCCMQAAFPA
jgi:hypothetical protein